MMGRPATLRAKVVDLLRDGPKTMPMLCKATGHTSGAIHSAVTNLEFRRVVVRRGSVPAKKGTAYLFHLTDRAVLRDYLAADGCPELQEAA